MDQPILFTVGYWHALLASLLGLTHHWLLVCMLHHKWQDCVRPERGFIPSSHSRPRSRRHQLASDERVSELQAELQVRKFECERMQMVHEETVRDLKHCQLDQEKLRKKVGSHQPL